MLRRKHGRKRMDKQEAGEEGEEEQKGWEVHTRQRVSPAVSSCCLPVSSLNDITSPLSKLGHEACIKDGRLQVREHHYYRVRDW